ncbi:MAG: hypothetical protein H5U08_10410, partial [Thermogutta sp.]|uniref:hypothetical protein n=1 Tax=Thermogutta sp. TaxID=1962930 RepID=UPI0019962352
MRFSLLFIVTCLLIARNWESAVLAAETTGQQVTHYQKLIEACPGLTWYLPLQSFDDVLAKEGRVEGNQPQVVRGPDGTMALRF